MDTVDVGEVREGMVIVLHGHRVKVGKVRRESQAYGNGSAMREVVRFVAVTADDKNPLPGSYNGAEYGGAPGLVRYGVPQLLRGGQGLPGHGCTVRGGRHEAPRASVRGRRTAPVPRYPGRLRGAGLAIRGGNQMKQQTIETTILVANIRRDKPSASPALLTLAIAATLEREAEKARALATRKPESRAQASLF